VKTGGPVARVDKNKKTKRMFRLPTNSASLIIGIRDGKLINARTSISRARLSALEQPCVKAFASLAVKLLTLLIVIADYNVGDNKRDNNDDHT